MLYKHRLRERIAGKRSAGQVGATDKKNVYMRDISTPSMELPNQLWLRVNTTCNADNNKCLDTHIICRLAKMFDFKMAECSVIVNVLIES